MHISPKLHVDWLVETVGGLEVGADFRRERLFLVERTAGRHPRQQEGQCDDERECRYCAEEAPKNEGDGGHPAAFVAHGATPLQPETREQARSPQPDFAGDCDFT